MTHTRTHHNTPKETTMTTVAIDRRTRPLEALADELGTTVAELATELTRRGVPLAVPSYAVAELVTERAAEREAAERQRAELEKAKADQAARDRLLHQLQQAKDDVATTEQNYRLEKHLMENATDSTVIADCRRTIEWYRQAWLDAQARLADLVPLAAGLGLAEEAAS